MKQYDDSLIIATALDPNLRSDVARSVVLTERVLLGLELWSFGFVPFDSRLNSQQGQFRFPL